MSNSKPLNPETSLRIQVNKTLSDAGSLGYRELKHLTEEDLHVALTDIDLLRAQLSKWYRIRTTRQSIKSRINRGKASV